MGRNRTRDAPNRRSTRAVLSSKAATPTTSEVVLPFWPEGALLKPRPGVAHTSFGGTPAMTSYVALRRAASRIVAGSSPSGHAPAVLTHHWWSSCSKVRAHDRHSCRRSATASAGLNEQRAHSSASELSLGVVIVVGGRLAWTVEQGFFALGPGFEIGRFTYV